MRKHASHIRTQQQQQRGRKPPIPLHILQCKQILITKQIAIITRQHHARKPIIFERARRDGLAARLKGHGRERDGEVPAQLCVVVAATAAVAVSGDDGGGYDDEEHLDRVAGY